MTLKSLLVLFEPLETSAASLASSASATSLASTASPALFPQIFPHLDDSDIPGTKMANMSPFLCKE